MTKEQDSTKSIDGLARLIEVLNSFPSNERVRLMRAAMELFGETPSPLESARDDLAVATAETYSPRGRVWMKQNAITSQLLQEVFYLADGEIEVIAPQMPGKNKKEQTYNAYILSGIGQLLLTGTASFDDKSARSLCEKSGCYDSANHSAHLRDRGNEFAGSKEKGWTLTAPGLKKGAEIIKAMQGVASS